jgi:hypothetical protein
MFDLARIFFLFFCLVLIPVVLVLATPFVLLWPRPDSEETYGQAVLRRYGKIIQVLCHVGNAI